MKILHVIPFFSPKFGGSVAVLNDLSKHLIKRNHEVTIITTDFGFDQQYADNIRAEGASVVSFPCLINIKMFLYSPLIKTWAKKNLKEYDIIHLHNFRSYQNIVIHKYAMKYGIPIILQAHGSILPFFERQTIKKLHDIFWGDKILKDVSKVIAVSKVEKDQYLKMRVPENKIEIIPNGIDVSEYKTLPERGKFRKKYGIASDDKIILYLGRLHKSKGLDFLINGYFSILTQYQNVKLVIAGPDDGFLNDLMKQIKKNNIADNIIVTGPLYRNEKIEAYVDIDVLVYPGIIEIFGLVPFEAIMCGAPVIVSDYCGCGEVIQEAHCGYLVHHNDIPNLKSTIINVLKNSESNKKMVHSGRQYIRENLAWDKIIKRVEKIYENVRNSNETFCNSLSKINTSKLKGCDPFFTHSVNFNIHSLIYFSIEGNNKKIIDDLEKYFAFFKTEEPIKPDIKIVFSDFIPELDNCKCIDRKYYTKENYLYCNDAYKLVRWNLCIKNLYNQPIIYFNGSPYSEIIFRDQIIEPLLSYKLGQIGVVLLHASSISSGNKGFVFSGHSHVGKTSILLKHARKNISYFSDELAITSENGILYSYPSPIRIFYLNMKGEISLYQKLTAYEKNILKLKYLLKIYSNHYLTFPQYIPGEKLFTKVGTKIPLDSMILLSRTTKTKISLLQNVDKSQFVKELININKHQFYIFSKYLTAYSSLNPEINTETYWNTMENNLLKSIKHTHCYEIKIPMDSDYCTYEDIDKILEEMEV